jgi:hypothetical protein
MDNKSMGVSRRLRLRPEGGASGMAGGALLQFETDFESLVTPDLAYRFSAMIINDRRLRKIEVLGYKPRSSKPSQAIKGAQVWNFEISFDPVCY